MTDDTVDLRTALVLLANVTRFATEHPYAATGIIGAAAGSAATYSIMSKRVEAAAAGNVVDSTVYDVELPEEQVAHMLADPEHVKIRYDFPFGSVVLRIEKREPFKQLPDIIVD